MSCLCLSCGQSCPVLNGKNVATLSCLSMNVSPHTMWYVQGPGITRLNKSVTSTDQTTLSSTDRSYTITLQVRIHTGVHAAILTATDLHGHADRNGFELTDMMDYGLKRWLVHVSWGLTA